MSLPSLVQWRCQLAARPGSSAGGPGNAREVMGARGARFSAKAVGLTACAARIGGKARHSTGGRRAAARSAAGSARG